MQIIDSCFGQDRLKVTLILKRHTMPWDVGDADYIQTYLKTLVQYANRKRMERGVYTVYDLCIDLNLEPKKIYSFIGYGKDDEIECSLYFDDKKIMIGLVCKLLQRRFNDETASEPRKCC